MRCGLANAQPMEYGRSAVRLVAFFMLVGNEGYHVQNICDSGELSREATVKEIMTVQEEGERQVSRRLEYQIPMRMRDFEREAKRIVDKREGPDE